MALSNITSSWGGASKQSPNIRSYTAPIKNPVTAPKTGGQSYNPATSKGSSTKGGAQGSKQAIAATASPISAVTHTVGPKVFKENVPTNTAAQPQAVETAVEETIAPTAVTNLPPISSKNYQSDHLVKFADRVLSDPDRFTGSTKAGKKAKAARQAAPAHDTADNATNLNVSATFADKIEAKLEQKMVKRDIKQGRKNKPNKAGANKKDRAEFVYF